MPPHRNGLWREYLISPASVAKHIAYIEEVRPTATSPDMPRHVATTVANEPKGKTEDDEAQEPTDMPRHVAASPDTLRHISRVESENDFLRKQIGVKDEQIKDLTERARETNHLIAGLQKMLTPLLRLSGGGGDKYQDHRDQNPEGEAIA